MDMDDMELAMMRVEWISVIEKFPPVSWAQGAGEAAGAAAKFCWGIPDFAVWDTEKPLDATRTSMSLSIWAVTKTPIICCI